MQILIEPFYSVRIRIQPFSLMRIWIQSFSSMWTPFSSLWIRIQSIFSVRYRCGFSLSPKIRTGSSLFPLCKSGSSRFPQCGMIRITHFSSMQIWYQIFKILPKKETRNFVFMLQLMRIWIHTNPDQKSMKKEKFLFDSCNQNLFCIRFGCESVKWKMNLFFSPCFVLEGLFLHRLFF